ncbi:helix-turn-helix domain-containing protein [Pseudodesulfovibrio senegalensis]|uniref:Helix-turn-helix transcriptional regulator n=1 Tax=Pseudodesulfovibrio senegalensis TaxID=1721087 RepID=A0A6N6MWN5_9BACT|nr:helix-turn-helix transcriptional regulator [Pseudodesulfovibrio senegalensis]KAB1437319.1 helix-turn-helix transcriptional regulator [Pseudodesulfovibrio senegalensis]
MPLTDGNVQISLVVPGHQANLMEKAIAGFLNLAESLSDEAVIYPAVDVGRALKGFRLRAELSQQELSEQLRRKLKGAKVKYAQRHVSEMESGKRRVTDEEAKALAAILNADIRVFLPGE